MKFFSNFLKNKKYVNIIFTSSCVSLGLGYYYTKNQNALLSYTIENDDLILEEKFKNCNRLITQYKEQYGIPGVVVGVAKNGKILYSKADGYSDVENTVKATPSTIMRIASISKAIACVIAAKLYENGKLDFDKPVDFYLKDIPKFKFKGKEFDITCRQLMSHTSGIRHYKDGENENSNKDTQFKEFYLNRNFKTTKDALELFLNDELMNEPGTKHLYTTFGYTLLSAVLEKVSNDEPFSKLLNELFKKFDLNETFLDTNDPIIPNRSKFYMRDHKKKLINVPYVDNSYKWAGGGLLSNVVDLLKFGNLMLSFYQSEDNENKFIKSSTIKTLLWATQSFPSKNSNNNLLSESNEKITYGLGWCLCYNEFDKLKYVYHTGGAVGASSCLLIIPSENLNASNLEKYPNGIVVSVLCNSQDVSEIVKFSLSIARIFSD